MGSWFHMLEEAQLSSFLPLFTAVPAAHRLWAPHSFLYNAICHCCHGESQGPVFNQNTYHLLLFWHTASILLTKQLAKGKWLFNGLNSVKHTRNFVRAKKRHSSSPSALSNSKYFLSKRQSYFLEDF